MSIILSLAICTHNRATILEITLPFLKRYGGDDVEILLIDNASTDQTKAVFERMDFQKGRYIYEPNIGLSYARNRAIQEAKTNWIFYLDDDAKVLPNTLSKAIEIAEKYPEFGMIGGAAKSWYLDEKPKWLWNDFGETMNEFQTFTNIHNLEAAMPVGNIILYNKKNMASVEVFSTSLGMSGKRIGYGEETDLAIKAIRQGIPVGIEPDWQIEHLVASYKLKLRWHIKSEFQQKKTIFSINKQSLLPEFLYFIRGNLATIFYRIPKYILNKKYCFKFFILEFLRPNIWFFGSLLGKLKN